MTDLERRMKQTLERVSDAATFALMADLRGTLAERTLESIRDACRRTLEEVEDETVH